MSEERPNREVAYRVFAAEYDDAEYSYAESEEERAPNYVVTPTGARINRLFVVGVLTAVERVSEDVLRARIADPTGAFVVYAGQYQPEAMAFFDRTEPPAFVAVTGKARTFEPEDGDVIYTSVRPESANEVTAETRDRWVVRTTERTVDRIETMAGARSLAERGDALRETLSRRGVRPGLAAGIARALDHYETTSGYLAEMHRVATDAARVVADELDEVDPPSLAPNEEADIAPEIAGSLPPDPKEGAEAPSDAEPGVGDEPGEGEREGPSAEAEATGAPAASEDEGAESTEAAEPIGTTDSSTEGAESTRTEATEEAASPAGTASGETDDRPESVDADEAGADADGSKADVADESDESTAGSEDVEEMYELSAEEREAVEEEYDVGFETGNEVGEPGEAGIDVPGPEDLEEESAEESRAADEADAGDAAETDADGDLEDAVVETMADLDDGDGAPREELLAAVSEEYDVSPDAVEDALQDALMGGRCYESGEDRFTPI